MQGGPKHFSAGPGPTLGVHDSVVALLMLPGNRYLMQLRDDRPDIIFPGHWGCFGGAIAKGEDPLEGLRRELMEELELPVGAAKQYAKFDFDLGAAGRGSFFRMYFEVSLTDEVLKGLRLHEGADMKVFDADQLLHTPWVSPHDSFAIWLHRAGRRFSNDD